MFVPGVTLAVWGAGRYSPGTNWLCGARDVTVQEPTGCAGRGALQSRNQLAVWGAGRYSPGTNWLCGALDVKVQEPTGCAGRGTLKSRNQLAVRCGRGLHSEAQSHPQTTRTSTGWTSTLTGTTAVVRDGASTNDVFLGFMRTVLLSPAEKDRESFFVLTYEYTYLYMLV